MLRNITPIVRTSDKGLTAYITAIQYVLEQDINVEKSFGLAEFRQGPDDKFIPCEYYQDSSRYETLQPDGTVDSFSFIYIKNPIEVDDYNEENSVQYDRAEVNIVVFGTDETAYFIDEIEKVSKALIDNLDSFTITKVYHNGKDAYLDFPGVDIDKRHYYKPHYCFRLKGELIYPNAAGDNCPEFLPWIVRQANNI